MRSVFFFIGFICYYQVAATLMDATTFERELSSLKRTGDGYPKTVLTLDRTIATPDVEGVQVRNVLDWLLEAPAAL